MWHDRDLEKTPIKEKVDSIVLSTFSGKDFPMSTEQSRTSWYNNLLGQKGYSDDDTHFSPDVNGENAESPINSEAELIAEGDHSATTEDVAEGDRGAAVEAVEMEGDSSNATDTGGSPAKFVIPDEGEEDLLNENELDVEGDMSTRIRKAGKNEFLKIYLASLFTTSILYYKTDPESMDESAYWVVKKLRSKIAQDLRQVRFYLCYSYASRRFFIMPVKTSDTDWYRSLEVLFGKPAEFFLNNAIRIKADKDLGRYRILFRPEPEAVEWPTRPTAELVTEAIGYNNIISSPDHPVYVQLTSGEELK